MSLVLAADYRVPDFDHWWAGARSTKQVAEACGAGSVCGRCNHTIRTMIEDAAPDPPPRKPDRLRRRWGRS